MYCEASCMYTCRIDLNHPVHDVGTKGTHVRMVIQIHNNYHTNKLSSSILLKNEIFFLE
jgi:hypothetical protein